ncbi:hypothetical protein C942_03237 [Photobacterium marinum]|uniref:Uncharacterized protein n=1 Tax=Photobacterium marinum TaxID=1056511 RepID=L8J8U9_9GAMM|nr:hypothetical protein [Photobacterium marinum]ELR63892.1 hypothetical protein C942_03237 [Photobacterium marinum]
MSKRSILIVTIGNTDIKVLAKTKAGKTILKNTNDRSRSYLEKNDHIKKATNGTGDYILNENTITWNNDLSNLDYLEAKPGFVDFEDIERKPCVHCKNKSTLPTTELIADEDNRIQLVASKLLPLVEHIKQAEDIDLPKLVMVLNTDRPELDDKSLRQKEPYMFGSLLTRWLCEQFNLSYVGQLALPSVPSEQHAFYESCTKETLKSWQHAAPEGIGFFVNYLDGDQLAEGHCKDDPVLRLALTRIQACIQAATETYPDSNIIYSPGGGFAKFKPQIEAICELYTSKVYSWHEPEAELSDNKPGEALSDTHKFPSPDVSYRARKQCITLIKNGNFQGAAAIAAFFTDSKNKNLCDKNWAAAITEASLWLQGRSGLEALHQSVKKAQNTAVQNSTKPILPFKQESEMPNTLWAAFRVEAALRQGNIQDAIRFCCDISDIALQDLVGCMQSPANYELKPPVKIDSKQDKNNKGKKKAAKFISLPLAKEHTSYTDALTTLISDQGHSKKTSIQKILTKEGNLELNTNIKPRENSDLVGSLALNIVCELRQAAAQSSVTLKDLSQSHPLQMFEIKLNEPLEGRGTPRHYRNQITHGFMSETETNNAEQAFIDSKLWAEKDCNTRFLQQPLIMDLYCSFHLPDAQNQPLAELYRHFTDTLIAILRNAPVDFEPKSDIPEQKEPVMER